MATNGALQADMLDKIKVQPTLLLVVMYPTEYTHGQSLILQL